MINSITTFYATCDNCNKKSTIQLESKDEVVCYMENKGWKTEQVENGSFWDFCPECFRKRNDSYE